MCSGIRIHINVGQHCRAPFVDEESPSSLILRHQNHEHAHSNQSVQGSSSTHGFKKRHRSHRSMTSRDIQPNQPGRPTKINGKGSEPSLFEGWSMLPMPALVSR